MPSDAYEPAIDHGNDAIDRDARLGDIRRQDDLSLLRRADRTVLFGRGQIAVEGKEREIVLGSELGAALERTTNIGGAGEKHEDMTVERRFRMRIIRIRIRIRIR